MSRLQVFFASCIISIYMLSSKENNNFVANDEWEVLTPTGWQNFDGVKKISHEETCVIKYETNEENEIKTFTTSRSHQFLIKRNDEISFLPAELIEPGLDFLIDENDNPVTIISKTFQKGKTDLYDIVNVSNGYQYYADNIVTHNCAHVDGIDELWLGLRPTLSTGGNAILISTPSGVGTLFHKIWVGAQEGTSDFHPIELPWTVHPERDQEWFEKEKNEIIPAMGEKGVAQELLCSFMASGDTFLNAQSMQLIFDSIREPIATYGPADAHKKDVWIWAHPKTGHNYIIGADVARGDGNDFSSFHVVDTEADEVVSEYKGKIPPDKFAELLVEIGYRYNTALICSEKNNVGFATAIKLKELKYPNLYYEKFHKNAFMVYSEMDVENETPGFETAQKNRVQILARLEGALRNGALRVYSKRLYEELQTFVWKNGKAQAQRSYHDDVIMALALANNLYEAGGASGFTNDDIAKAMLAGMSTSTNTMGPGSHNGHQGAPPPVMTDGSLRDFTERARQQTQSAGRTHNYNDPFWKQFGWVWKD